MVFEIGSIPDEPRRLTQAVLQITELLGLYQAELARVLGIKCGDIGQLANGCEQLSPDTDAWARARQLVYCYQLLYRQLAGDGVAMRHWLRIEQSRLGGIPHRLIVDEGRLDDVVDFLKHASPASLPV